MALETAFVRVVGENPIVQGLAGGVVIAVLNILGAMLCSSIETRPRGCSTSRSADRGTAPLAVVGPDQPTVNVPVIPADRCGAQ